MPTVINMDTDEDESEIDDGEEEERVKRRHLILRSQIRTIKLVTPEVTTATAVEKKKPVIELKLPQTLHQPQVCHHSVRELGKIRRK